MSVWIASIFVSALCCAPAQSAPRHNVPGNPYFHTCRYRAGIWDECVQNEAQNLRPLFVEGIPELGVRPIDPLFVDAFNFSEASSKFRINLKMINVSMEGLKNYVVTGVRSNLQELSLEIRLRIPTLNFRSHYYMDGRFLFLAISGGGSCQYNFTDVENKIMVNGHLARRVSDDALHFRAASVRWVILPSKGSSHFSTFEGETSMYSRATSRLLNEHGEEAQQSFLRAAEVAFGEVLRERINRLMMNIPYRDLFPPGILPLHLLERPIADSEADEYPPISWVRPTTTTTSTTTSSTTTSTTTLAPTTRSPTLPPAATLPAPYDAVVETERPEQAVTAAYNDLSNGVELHPPAEMGEASDGTSGTKATLDGVLIDGTKTLGVPSTTTSSLDEPTASRDPLETSTRSAQMEESVTTGQGYDVTDALTVDRTPTEEVAESTSFAFGERDTLTEPSQLSEDDKKSEEQLSVIDEPITEAENLILTDDEIGKENNYDDQFDKADDQFDKTDDKEFSKDEDDQFSNNSFDKSHLNRDERGVVESSTGASLNISNDVDDNDTAVDTEDATGSGGLTFSEISHVVSEVAKDLVAEAVQVISVVLMEPMKQPAQMPKVRDEQVTSEQAPVIA